jgi:hypothetical protein
MGRAWRIGDAGCGRRRIGRPLHDPAACRNSPDPLLGRCLDVAAKAIKEIASIMSA